MDIKDFYFLTTNATKTKDFQKHGFTVKAFEKEVKEILSPYVEEVVLHKSKDTDLVNVIVEDTALRIEGADFFGTQIKDYWEHVEFDDSLHMRPTVWEVSVCLATEDKYYVATGRTHGFLVYPVMEDAYHFNKVFSVEHEGDIRHFGSLTPEDRQVFSPRIKAIEILKHALQNEDFSSLMIINKENVKNWEGAYQEPPDAKKKLTP